MALIAVASMSGAPGVTSTCLGLAAAWPDCPAVVVECDPSGGDIAATFGRSVSPGLVELATRAASGTTVDVTVTQTIRIGGKSVAVVCAPPGGTQVAAGLPLLTVDGGSGWRPSDADALADVGRVFPGSPAWPLLEAADAIVLVVTGTLGQVAHLRARLPDLVTRIDSRRVHVAVVGGPYQAMDVTDAFADTALAGISAIPRDRYQAALLSGKPVAAWRRRSHIWTRLATEVSTCARTSQTQEAPS